jgi:hypothetical protein
MTFTEVISQPPYPGAKPKEVAEIFVDRFVYWETVWVQNRWKDASPIFRFTAVETAKKSDLRHARALAGRSRKRPHAA